MVYTVEIIGFGIIILMMLVVIVRRQYIKNQMKQNKNLEQAANQIQLQIEEVADAVIGRMENRINHLEMLIAEADEKINELDEKIQYLQSNKIVDDSVGQRKEMSSSICAPKTEYRPQKVEQNLSKMNKLVLDLFEEGYTLDEIAKKTGMGKGAISLIKEMYK